MKSKLLPTLIILAFLVQACNLPSNKPVTETPTLALAIPPSPTQPAATAAPTGTLPPTNTPPPTLTSTPSVPIASPKDVAVNCRLGPGQAWLVLSGLNVGQSSQILGKNPDGSWWYIVDPFNANRNCWVSGNVTNTAGNIANIPVVETPKASVTNVTVKIDPANISVAGCVGPLAPSKIEGAIEVNGPTTVKWHFETQQGGALATETTAFDTFGTKTFSVSYTPTLVAAGTYWVRMIVTSPTNIQGEISYKIECP